MKKGVPKAEKYIDEMRGKDKCVQDGERKE